MYFPSSIAHSSSVKRRSDPGTRGIWKGHQCAHCLLEKEHEENWGLGAGSASNYLFSFFLSICPSDPANSFCCLFASFLFLPVQELQSKLEELNTYLIQSDVPQSPAVSVKQDRALSTSETPPETPETTKLPQNNRFSDALRNMFGKPKTDNVGAESWSPSHFKNEQKEKESKKASYFDSSDSIENKNKQKE